MNFAKAAILAALGAASVNASLIHQYDFSGGATDLVGTQNGTLFGGSSIAGGVLLLDGSGYVEFGAHIVPVSGSYSVALDFRLAGAQSGIHELISQGSSGGPGFYVGSSSSTDFRVTDSWSSSGAAFPTDLLWHRLVLVVDSGAGTSTLYLDGTAESSLGAAITTTALGTDTRLGKQFGPHGEFFLGSLDNLAIYDNALTAGEVNGLAGTPEPSAFWLMSLGAMATLRAYRRRQISGNRQ